MPQSHVMLGIVQTDSTPIFDFNRARSAIVDEVVARVCASVRDPLLVLNDAAYQETRRLGASKSGGAELAEWRALAGALGRMPETEQRAKLEGLVAKVRLGTSPETSTAASTSSPPKRYPRSSGCSSPQNTRSAICTTRST